MIVGFENGTLQSRSFETVYNSRDVKGSIVDIECERDDLYVLEDGASILVFDLDHYSHHHFHCLNVDLKHHASTSDISELSSTLPSFVSANVNVSLRQSHEHTGSTRNKK